MTLHIVVDLAGFVSLFSAQSLIINFVASSFVNFLLITMPSV